jgi:uncharacterized oxidoreductase
MELTNKIIFITGAAKGIGFELAKQLSAKGNTVIIGGRNSEVLDEIQVKFPAIETMVFDALNVQNLIKVSKDIEKKYGKLDVLFNNAAICNSYDFTTNKLDFNEIDTEICTNISSPIKLIKLFLPLLDNNTKTVIVNITSGVAYLPMHTLPVYSATKAALQSFTISLRVSLENTNIRVIEALPPLVATQMTENLIGKGKNMKKMTPEKCAFAIINGIEKEVETIRIGSSKSLFWGRRLFPSFVQKQINKM